MLESSILNYIKKTGVISKIKDLEKGLKITDEKEKNAINEALISLQRQGKIYLNDKENYILFPREYRLAKLCMSRNGNAHISTDIGKIDISSEDLNDAIDRDLVVVGDIYEYDDGKYCATVKKIIERSRNSVVCEYCKRGNSYTLKPQVSNKNLRIDVPENELKNLVDGDYVKVDLSIDNKGKTHPTITKKIGHRDDPEIDIKNIAAEYDIEIDFSDEALKQLDDIPNNIESLNCSKRVDFRDKNFVTIDCQSTKDMDDAICVEGNKLYVAIADVDEFVGYDSPLYKEASMRSTSWYPFTKCIPMLPHQLSNGICSLNENEDRFAIVYEITLDDNGKLKDYDIYQGIIKSRKKMTYDDVNLILEKNIIPEGYEEFVPMLKEMEVLSKKIQTIKEKSGYIDLYRPDIGYETDVEDKITNIVPVYQHTAEKIIENFMVQANVVLIMYLANVYDSVIYRVHDMPDEDKLNDMIEFINNIGIDFKPQKGTVTSKDLQKLLLKIKGKEYAPVVSELILRAMPRARYDTNNIGHFALGNIPYYGHTTSPIRRFVDLITQSMVKKYQNGEFVLEPEIFRQQLQEIAEYASYKERQAKEAEIEVNKMKTAEYMQQYEGRIFEGVISHVGDSGLYAKINDVIEGKVNIKDIEGDRFTYDPKNEILIGKRTKQVYRVGQKVLLEVKSASKIDRSINYKIPNALSKDITNNKNDRRNAKQKVLARRNSL